MLRRALSALALFVAFAGQGYAQLGPEYYENSTVERQTRIFQLQAAIEQAEREGGYYSPQMGEIMLDLGRVYQEFGDYEEAIVAYKRAAHSIRFNEGLHSEQQIVVLEELIKSYIGAGMIAEADETYFRLFGVQTKLYPIESEQYATALVNYAEWQRTAYRFKLGGRTYARLQTIEDLYKTASPYHPTLNINRFYNCYLIKAYAGEPVPTFQMTVNGHGGDNKEADQTWHRFKMFGKNIDRNGVQILSEYLERELEPDERTRVVVMLGDWHLWNGRTATAKKFYLEAYQTNPELFAQPVQIPPADAYPDERHFDRIVEHSVTLTFQVRDSGRLRNIEVSDDDNPAAIRAVKGARDWRFRPQIVDGEFIDADNIHAVFELYAD